MCSIFYLINLKGFVLALPPNYFFFAKKKGIFKTVFPEGKDRQFTVSFTIRQLDKFKYHVIDGEPIAKKKNIITAVGMHLVRFMNPKYLPTLGTILDKCVVD